MKFDSSSQFTILKGISQEGDKNTGKYEKTKEDIVSPLPFHTNSFLCER